MNKFLLKVEDIFKPASAEELIQRRRDMPPAVARDLPRPRARIRLVRSFVDGETRGTASALSIRGNVLYSYATPIALRKDGRIYMADKRYSRTTSVHQNAIRHEGHPIIVTRDQFATLLDDAEVWDTGRLE